MSLTLRERLIEQLSPLAPLLESLVDDAYDEATVKRTAEAFPSMRRVAHLKRVTGTVRWILVADGLVAAGAEEDLPDGFSVRSTESQHNQGRYAFAFPGGVFSVRREPHDDDHDQGRFLQTSFEHVTQMMDAAGSPSAATAVRVWIAIAPEGRTKLTARDRHNHETVVTLTELLEAATVPATSATAPEPARTQVRSNRARTRENIASVE